MVALREAWAKETTKPTPTVAYFLQEGHTQSKKATPPSSASLYKLMGASYIQAIAHTMQHQWTLEHLSCCEAIVCSKSHDFTLHAKLSTLLEV